MVGTSQVFSLAYDAAKYVKACGKRSILERKPIQGKINLNSLEFVPFAIGDTVQISKTTLKQPSVNKLELSFLPNKSTLFPKEIRKLVSELPLEHKMCYTRGGQKVTYPRHYYNGYLDYTVNRFVHSPKGYTNGLDDCIAVLLHNNEDAFLYHLAPNVHKDKLAIADMQQAIRETVAKLEKMNKKCTAVLVGGDDKKGSIPLYENILDVLKEKCIKPQEILFAEGHKSIYYDIKKGIMVVDDGYYTNIEELLTEYKKVKL